MPGREVGMRKFAFPLLLGLALSGCEQSQPDAQTQASRGDQLILNEIEKYDMVRDAGGSRAQLCSAAGSVAAMALYQRNDAYYREWELARRRECGERQ